MKTKIFIIFLTLLLIFPNATISQEKNHIAGISYGFQYQITDTCVRDPNNLWIETRNPDFTDEEF